MSRISDILAAKHRSQTNTYNNIGHFNPTGSTIGSYGQFRLGTNNSHSARMDIGAVDINTINQAGCTLVSGYGNKRY